MNKSSLVLPWFSIIFVLLLLGACAESVDPEIASEGTGSSTDSSALSSDAPLNTEPETLSSSEKHTSGVTMSSSIQSTTTESSSTESSATQRSSTLSSSLMLESSVVAEVSSALGVSSSDNEENSSSSAVASDTTVVPNENPDFLNWGLPGPTIPHGFGVNIHFRKNSKQLTQIAAAGIKLIRMDIFWHIVEKEKGTYNWEAYDSLVAGCEQRGIQLLFILAYSNENYEEYGNSVWTHAGRVGWTDFAVAAVTRYKEKNIIWELWNEPNIYNFWAPNPDVNAYMKLMDRAVPAIKAAHPDIVLLGSATSHIDMNWHEDTFKQGFLNYIDAVSVHPYRAQDPETAQSEYDGLRSLIRQYNGGNDKPVVSSEWGYSNINWDNNPLSDHEQARRLVRIMLTNISKGVNLSIWYDWRNDGEDGGNREHNFGLVERDYTPKLAYYAYQTLNTVLNGYKFMKRIDSGTPGVYYLKFGKGDDRIYAFWKEGASETRDIYNSLGSVEIVDMFGERQTATWSGDSFKWKFSNSPRYMIV
ncbi:MAG: glycoside hydrolase family 5 protein, partial [Fibrobacterales bacterium]